MQTFKEWMTKRESFEPEHIFAGYDLSGPAKYSHPKRGGIVHTGVRVQDNMLIISKPKMGGKVGDMLRAISSYFGTDSTNVKDTVEAFYKDLKNVGYRVEKPKETDFGFILKFSNNLDAQRAFHRTKNL